MAIIDRNLKAGTRLVARYKKTLHTCEVAETDEGIRYQLADGRLFKSPSSAGSAVMGGVACNGWRFWSLENAEGEPADRPAPKPEAEKKNGNGKPRIVRQVKKLPNQKGVPAGQVKYHCSACQDAFLSATEPEACPKGHAREVVDDLAAVS